MYTTWILHPNPKYIDPDAWFFGFSVPQYIGADTGYMEKVEQDEAKG